jgi:hypothetical protein
LTALYLLTASVDTTQHFTCVTLESEFRRYGRMANRHPPAARGRSLFTSQTFTCASTVCVSCFILGLALTGIGSGLALNVYVFASRCTFEHAWHILLQLLFKKKKNPLTFLCLAIANCMCSNGCMMQGMAARACTLRASPHVRIRRQHRRCHSTVRQMASRQRRHVVSTG